MGADATFSKKGENLKITVAIKKLQQQKLQVKGKGFVSGKWILNSNLRNCAARSIDYRGGGQIIVEYLCEIETMRNNYWSM